MNKCPECSTENPETNSYCGKCGASLNVSSLTQKQEPINEWYYFIEGEKMGPVSDLEMIQLYNTKIVILSTKIWKSSMPKWEALKKTGLIRKENYTHRPNGAAINNVFVWGIAFVPILAIAIFYYLSRTIGTVSNFLWIAIWLLTILLCNADERMLHKAGYRTKELVFWALLFIPVYLFRRAHLVKQRYTYALVWCLLFGILITSSLWISGMPGASDPHIISSMKNGNFESYPDKTFGEMVDDFFENPRWESMEAEDGNTYVNIHGKIMYSGKKVKVKLQYKYNSDQSFEYNALEFNGVPQDVFVYAALLDAMYNE